MPYTPPAQQSPVASKPETPAISRSHSYVKPISEGSSSPNNTSPRPVLPRSASSTSYLRRHRRSPSVTKSTTFPASPFTPDTTPLGQEFPSSESEPHSQSSTSHGSRTSIPPGALSIPTGAVISPPDSAQNSSDDEINTRRSRVRELENLAELQAAIRIIEQHRESSPNRAREETKKARMTLGLIVPSSEYSAIENNSSSTTPLSKEARKISHSRSATDVGPFPELSHSPIRDSPSPRTSSSGSDEDDTDGPRVKPPMLRKKSGELVRPALRPPSRRRPSSMPGTPTYSKAVHFDAHLEHVRHFLQVDRPLAVSAGTSPVDNYDNEAEFPFGSNNDDSTSTIPSFQWEIRLSNFPTESIDRSSLPVRVEKVYLSSDNKQLLGSVAVANLAFHKTVVARFTLDYWKTTSEVLAEFNNDVRRKQVNDGYDRFNFTIKLEDLANLENKTMFFCVRYNVNGQEYWDSNNNINYQVDFAKKPVQTGKQGELERGGVLPAGAAPRSRPSPPASAGMQRPKTTCFDEFTADFGSFPQPAAKSFFADAPLRFRSTKTDPLSHGHNRVPAQAFGNRYDFGASLSAAIQGASTTVTPQQQPKEESKLPAKSAKRPAFHPRPSSGATATNVPLPTKKDTTPVIAAPASSSAATVKGTAPAPTTANNPSKPLALTSGKPSLQSQSYHELLDKYCFVRSPFRSLDPEDLYPKRIRALIFFSFGFVQFGSAKSSTSSSPSHHQQQQHQQQQQQQKQPSPSSSSSSTPPKSQSDGALDDDNASVDSDCPSPSPISHAVEQDATAGTVQPQQQISRSQSPATGSGLSSRTPSSTSFTYPYRQPLQGGWLGEGGMAPTAIRGW